MTRLLVAVLLVLLCISPTLAQHASLYDLAALADSGLRAGVAIEIVRHGGGIWMASGKGLQVTFDHGLTWLNHHTGTGLVSDNVSALFSTGSRLWIATNHTGSIGSGLVNLSDGVTYTDDNGGVWTQIDFGGGGLNIPYVWGGDRLIFDITGAHDTDTYRFQGVDWTFFTAFAGGFLASRDNGTHWRRIYPSSSDSIQFNTPGQAPSLRNRYFAAAADTSHGDTLIVWTGTAGGVIQYTFVQPREKLFSKQINGIAFCTSCDTMTRVLLGGNGGVSIGGPKGGPFVSRFESDGLPGRWISAIANVNGRVLVGTGTAADTSTGLAISTDAGATFVPVSVSPAPIGAGKSIRDFAVIRDRIYMAAEGAGMFVSADTGANWTALLIDSLAPARATNAANAFDVSGDTLRVGTDSGLVMIAMDSLGNFTARDHVEFAESDSSSRRIIRVRTQQFINDSTLLVDSTRIWTCNRPMTPAGRSMVGRSKSGSGSSLVFDHYQVEATADQLTTYDVNFLGDTAIVVGTGGARYTATGANPASTFAVSDSVSSSLNMSSDSIKTIVVRGDTLVLGSNRAVAFSTNRGKKFRLYRANTDTLSADLAVNYTVLNTLNTTFSRFGLTGDFVPAVGVQLRSGQPAQAWFSGRPVDAGTPGITKTRYDSTGKMALLSMNEKDFAWNFEFDGDTVYAATNAGLLRHIDAGPTLDSIAWDTIALVNGLTNDTLVAPGTPVYAVRKNGNYLWVGTEDGTVRIDLSNINSQHLFMPVDSATPKDQVYAFPVPFFPVQGGTLDFHFVVDQPGSVTVEVYDFAMNLVARPIDNVSYAAGIYPNGSQQGRTWDGRNGRGHLVAVGVYYFKVILPGGTTRWGKLAVMP
ncbi:MAG: hypothetical protein HY851_05935 [candidate division Zixibacteria bacterium]|nr:hypothetical protein [candidate division Zixibacteria bacterium]